MCKSLGVLQYEDEMKTRNLTGTGSVLISQRFRFRPQRRETGLKSGRAAESGRDPPGSPGEENLVDLGGSLPCVNEAAELGVRL